MNTSICNCKQTVSKRIGIYYLQKLKILQLYHALKTEDNLYIRSNQLRRFNSICKCNTFDAHAVFCLVT